MRLIRKTKEGHEKHSDKESNFEDQRLLKQMNDVLVQVHNGNLTLRLENTNSEQQEVTSNFNKLLDLLEDSLSTSRSDLEGSIQELSEENKEYKHQIKELNENLIFANKIAKIGLWEMNVVAGDPVNPNNTFMWTEDFRHVLGFDSEREFPNVLGSWGDRIHPDDSERVYSAFGAHMSDRTDTVPFDVKYKIMLKNGEYHWVHSQGSTVKDENGNPVRCIGSIQDINDEKMKEFFDIELTAKIENFYQSMREIVESIKDVTHTAQELANYQQDTMKISEKIKSGADETKAIIAFIKNISTQTNLLGLNASIEAARSGQTGSGFNVVASEIRNLSISSSDAVEKIGKSINDMNSLIDNIVVNMENINGITQSQAATTEEVNACVDQVNDLIEELVTMVKSI